MMDIIIENSEQFFNISQTISILIYTCLTSYLYVHYLKPFVIRKRASYAAGIIYLVMSLPNVFIDTSASIFRIIPVLIVIITVLFTWILDDRRNLVQKIFLGIVYSQISWMKYSQKSGFSRGI